MKKELLAPAGDVEAGYAALYYGADAVYLGLKQFSARATAQNFSEDELNEFVGFAHSLKRKVFVTINTVLQQAELDDLMKNLDICKRCRIDAVILQDLGVARIIKNFYPEIEMHASTQMAVHNKEGALVLKNAGFSRVVLARELSLPEMKEIATIPDLELEAFVHGALCYSYSGVCQFSSVENGRSANRGKCLYPCRSLFQRKNGEEHCFSMRDMALGEDVLKMPVYSLKIEGRKKNALYVAAVTDYYRHILDGDGAILQKEQNIRQIFSRPWCKFHFKGRNKDVTDTKFVGHRGLCIGKAEEVKGNCISFSTAYPIAKHDGIQIDIEGQEKPYGFSLKNFKANGKSVVEAKVNDKIEMFLPVSNFDVNHGAKIYLASSSAVKGAYGYQKPKPREFLQRQKIDVAVTITEHKVIAQCKDWQAEINGHFEQAQNAEKMEQAVQSVFAKTGETVFDLGKLEVKNTKNLFVPVSLLNSLRRDLYDKIVPDTISTKRDFINARQLPLKAKWIVKTDDVRKISALDFDQIDEIILLINEKTEISEIQKLPKNKLRLALPLICRNVSDFEPLITKLLNMGYTKWEIANYWGLSVLPLKKIDLSFDNQLYMFNEQAVQFAKELGVSRVTLAVEDTLSNLKDLTDSASLSTVVVVYQDVPLFNSAVCIRENACSECTREPKWMQLYKDGQLYLAYSKNCQTFLFANQPLSIAEDCKGLRTDFYRADFCYKDYTPQETKRIFEQLVSFKDGQKVLKANIQRKTEIF
ncbi:MAG: DUF3656 domain-containing protein [Alphaproteobacteria bacterium]|nr:DUF3656 domain-containing protein [Alphaproteobacteria bacterium]